MFIEKALDGTKNIDENDVESIKAKFLVFKRIYKVYIYHKIPRDAGRPFTQRQVDIVWFASRDDVDDFFKKMNKKGIETKWN